MENSIVKPEVFITKEWFDALIEKVKENSVNPFEENKYQKIFDVLTYNVHLLFEKDFKELNEFSEESIYKYIMKRSLAGGSRIDVYNPQTESEYCEYPNSIQLKGKDKNYFKELKENIGQWGVEVPKLDTLFSILFQSQTINVSKQHQGKSIISWEDAFKQIQIGNSLIIIDRYILDYNGLERFLEILLPDKLHKTDFHLTIITRVKIPNTEKEKANKLIRRVKLLRNYNLEVDVVYDHSRDNLFHDRYIIGNYFFASIGTSIKDVFKLEKDRFQREKVSPSSETKIHLHSIFENANVHENGIPQLNSIQSDLRNYKKIKEFRTNQCFGSLEINRLVI